MNELLTPKKNFTGSYPSDAGCFDQLLSEMWRISKLSVIIFESDCLLHGRNNLLSLQILGKGGLNLDLDYIKTSISQIFPICINQRLHYRCFGWGLYHTSLLYWNPYTYMVKWLALPHWVKLSLMESNFYFLLSGDCAFFFILFNLMP